MTEADWLAATDPSLVRNPVEKVSWRRLQLYAVACARRLWALFPDDACLRMVEAVERVADDPRVETDDPDVTAEADRLFAALQMGYEPFHETEVRTRGAYLAALACGAALHDAHVASEDTPTTAAIAVAGEMEGPSWETERRVQADLARCIFGNPFRPVAFDSKWRTETAVALASGIYELRAFDRLPILADALEDAGCDAADLLAHLRGPGPHARGCWPLDLVLGKS